MTRQLLTLLLIPLVLLFSISAKALEGGKERALLKGGVLEAVFELPSAEVSPDIDHALLTASRTKPISFAKSKAKQLIREHSKRVCYAISCRGPPRA